MLRLLFCLFAISWALADQLGGDVVYTSTDTNSSPFPRIVMKPASGGASTPETVLFTADCWNTNPRFSWNKKAVVFASGMAYSSVSPTLTLLYTIPTDNSSSAPQRVTTLSKNEYNEFAADWSLDDTEFVIEYSWHSSQAGMSESNTRLGIVSTSDSSSFTPLMENKTASYNDYCARWNPKDKNYILFLSDRAGPTEPAGIYLYDFRKDAATLLDLPPQEPASANCPFWDINGHSFHYEVERENPFMAVVDLNAPVIVSVYEFQINLVNSVCCSGIAEYIQCTSGPSPPSSFSCLRSGPQGDTIAIINDSGELVQNVTATSPSVYHMTPDWK